MKQVDIADPISLRTNVGPYHGALTAGFSPIADPRFTSSSKSGVCVLVAKDHEILDRGKSLLVHIELVPIERTRLNRFVA